MSVRSVYKYRLSEPTTFHNMPKGAQILHVATQDGDPHLWALVDPAAETEQRAFRVYGTGHTINDHSEVRLDYLGTCHDVAFQGLVFHVFESVPI